MTIIHMEVDQCRNARQQMVDIRRDLSDHASAIINKGEALTGNTWRAQGAEQYLSELYTWKNDLLKLLAKVDNLGWQLEAEIAEWLRVSRDA